MSTASRVFLDTNILVYGRLQQSHLYKRVEDRLTDMESAGDEFWISRQILREYLAVMSGGKGLTAVPSMADLLADVQHFCSRFHIAEDGSVVTQQLVQLLPAVSCAGKQIHDANIVATMLAGGVARLLTHNVGDFQRFVAYITIEPLVP